MFLIVDSETGKIESELEGWYQFKELASFSFSEARLGAVAALNSEEETPVSITRLPPKLSNKSRPVNLPLYKQLPVVKVEKDEIDQPKQKSVAFAATDPPNGPGSQIEKLQQNPLLQEVQALFEHRPIWLKNSLIHQLTNLNVKMTAGMLKAALAAVSYAFDSGPWRHAYVKYGFFPKSDKQSVIYQVIDFRVKSLSKLGKMRCYDPTFTSLPVNQGQLYQLCEIDVEDVRDIFSDQENINFECTKEYGWLRREAYENIKEIMKEQFKVMLNSRVGRPAVYRNYAKNANKQSNEEPAVQVDNIILQAKEGLGREPISSDLTMWRLPWGSWLICAVLIGCSIYMCYHVSGGEGRLFDGFDEGHWWQVLIIVFMFLLAAIFFYFSKIEQVKFDKNTGHFVQAKYVLFFRVKSDTQKLSDILKIDLYGAGRKTIHENSIHYKVLIKMRNGIEYKILETKGQMEAFAKAQQIRNFLNIHDEIQFSNHLKIEV